MEKLSLENIQFIDNYLDNSNIIYADIRMEMTDHVASEIETRMKIDENQSFYDVFKIYMVENKANLLNNNKYFLREADKSILRKIGRLILKLKTLLVFVIVFFCCFQLIKILNQEQLKTIVWSSSLISITILLISYFILLKAYKFPRFSSIERLGYIYMGFSYIFNLTSTFLGIQIKNNVNIIVIAAAFSVVVTLVYILIKVSYNVIKKHTYSYKLK